MTELNNITGFFLVDFMNIEQTKSKFINELWNTLDANNDGVFNNKDKCEIEKQNNSNLSIYTKFENELGDVSITKTDCESACENAYNIDDVIKNLKNKNILNENKPAIGLISADITEQTENNTVEKRDSQNRLIYERDEDGTEHFHEYNDDGTEKSTTKYTDGSINVTIRDKFGRAIYREDSDKKINIIYDNEDADACTQEISYSSGMKSTLKYNEENELVEFTSSYNGFVAKCSKQNFEYVLEVINTKTGDKQTFDFSSNVEGSFDEKYQLFNVLSEIGADILYDLATENPKIRVRDVEDNGAYAATNDNGEYIVLDRDNSIDSVTFIHELGHIIDHTYNSNKEEGFSSDNPDFQDAFNIGVSRFNADGNKQHKERNTSTYCTWNTLEFFAECYEYIMTGNCASSNVITKYFPEALELTKQYIDDVRKGKYGKRNLT